MEDQLIIEKDGYKIYKKPAVFENDQKGFIVFGRSEDGAYREMGTVSDGPDTTELELAMADMIIKSLKK